MRLFAGIALPDAVTHELKGLCGKLRRDGDGLRWSPSQSWHITLQFLGNAEAEQFECLRVRLAEVRVLPVPVRLGELNVFERAGAFVIEVALTKDLEDLERRVVEATRRCGFVPEERGYHPHITLARANAKGRSALKQLKHRAQDIPVRGSFTAHGFLLYESHLGAGGSKYEVRARFELGG